ncbi:MAG: HD-GYP domain-containing protein [Gemmataceae bacterium]
MSETVALVGKIAALRQRLQQAQGLATEAGTAAAALFAEESEHGDLGEFLHKQIHSAAAQQTLVDDSLRQLKETGDHPLEAKTLPVRLTAQARRLLEQGREFLGQLRSLGELLDEPEVLVAPRPPGDSLTRLYREIAAMTDTALRMIQAFPNAPSAQLHLCQGLEPIFALIGERLAGLQAAVSRRRHEKNQLHILKDFLTALVERKPVDVKTLVRLGEAILTEAVEQNPLAFHHGAPWGPADWIPAHCLNVAQVMARVVRHNADLRGRPLDAVLAALVHDVGMLETPTEILTQVGPLTDDSRRLIEAHAFAGTRLAGRLFPGGGWLLEAIESHHERSDGTGYPGGKRDNQISPLGRLLAVCDVYAAQCAGRPHRGARETRTALTDTLLMADRGQLDQQAAEHLLLLGFYPVGSVVELTDGAIGMVVATPVARHDLQSPARPVVELWTDAQGKALAVSRFLDLGQSDHGGIVRSAPLSQRMELTRRIYHVAA